jgi:RNA polymerase sigma factor (sigma-70 family)
MGSDDRSGRFPSVCSVTNTTGCASVWHDVDRILGLEPCVNAGEVIDLYDRHSRELVGYFARRARDPQVALDLLGQTFLAAFEQRRGCRARTDRERAAWLYRIAANELADHFRRGAREQRAINRLGVELRALNDHEAAVIEQLGASSELGELVSAAFTELSDEQQQAVHLHVNEERAYPELSQHLGVSEPAVRARVSRGLRALRRATGRRNEEQR